MQWAFYEVVTTGPRERTGPKSFAMVSILGYYQRFAEQARRLVSDPQRQRMTCAPALLTPIRPAPVAGDHSFAPSPGREVSGRAKPPTVVQFSASAGYPIYRPIEGAWASDTESQSWQSRVLLVG